MTVALTEPSPSRPPAAADLDRSPRTGVRMTVEEFLRLPEDSTLDRWLIDGEVWEQPMTVRSRPHSICESRVVQQLRNWLDEGLPGGEVASGESGVLLPGRATALGTDAVVFDAATVAAQPPPPEPGEGMDLWHGTPLLVVEVVSGSDRDDVISSKVNEYLAAGVLRVWVARPGLKTLTIHCPDAPAETFQGDRTLENDPALPGLRVRAADLFGT